MRNLIQVCVLAISLFVLFSFPAQADDNSLKIALEKIWNQYITACDSGKESAVKETMSSFRFGTMMNNLASAKLRLTPEIVKSIAKHSPKISKMRFVKVIENGPTAGLLYVQDSKERDTSNNPRITFAFIKFVKEESGWKVDVVMNRGRPKYQDDGKETEFTLSDLPESFAIDGKVLKAPEAIPIPDVSGFVDVFSYGYTTQVTINGVEQTVAHDGSPSRLIKGGLRKGQNSIIIVFKKTKKDGPHKPRVTIRQVVGEHDTKEVFKCEPKNNIEGQYTFTFTIDE